MKPKLLILFAIVIVFATACCEDNYHRIPEEYKIVYEIGDTVIYKSNHNNYDTFICEDNRYLMHPGDAHCITEVYEEGNINFNHLNDSNNYYFYRYANLGYFRIHDFNDFSFENIGDRPMSVTFNEHDSTFRIDSKIFNVVMVLTDTTITEEFDNLVNKIYMNHKYGILQYEYYSGEIFKIHKLIPNYYETEME